MGAREPASSPELAGFAWEIDGPLGKGTTGDVFHVSRDGRFAALKVARGDDGFVDREGRLLARLDRRWGPRLIERGVVPNGVKGLRSGAAYIVTTLAEGEPLDARGKRDRRELAAVVAHGVGRALDELHAMGVRHGDVKPANIVVAGKRPTRDRASERGATLLDLDLATDVGRGATGGTPKYLAPEIARGEEPTPASDLYALGLVLKEITTDDEIGRWVEALLADAPGARPSASWIAGRAARLLDLEEDEEEVVAARRARVKRAYLAVRAPSIANAAAVDPAVDGTARRWLLDAIASVGTRGEGTIGALDALGVSRWVTRAVGPDAASWPRPEGREGELAERFLSLCAIAPPEGWTLDDVLGRTRSHAGTPDAHGEELWVQLTRDLVAPRPSFATLARAEDEVAKGRAPNAVVRELATALLRRGEIGRAGAALATLAEDDREALQLRAEIARRRGDREGAARLAKRAGAAALCARIAWDAGDFDAADRALAGASGAAAAEVKALLAYSRGAFDAGVAAAREGAAEAENDLVLARLHGTRGMLEHARGRARDSLEAFTAAADVASRSGAVFEEATYLTGLAAAAVDAGDVARALPAATRAALLWERASRANAAARAHLARAAAFALVFAQHDADVAAEEARRAARAAGDARAAAYARWAIVETRAPGDARAREEALAAYAELPEGEDRVRAAARVLSWGARDVDADPAGCSPAARWEWWGARAARGHAAALPEILALLETPAPLGSRGPALAAAAVLARSLGDGDALREGTPAELRGFVVPWTREDEVETVALAPAQVAQLESIVRSLSSRDRLKPLLEQVIDTMVLWTGVERGLLLLRAPDGKLVPRAARNLARRDLSGDQLALSTGLAKRAMEDRQAICATDAFAQVGDLHASVHALRLRSVLAVPLVARGDVLGVVYLDDRVRRGAFGPSELAWVNLVASQAALAIADARDQVLLRRAVRRAERANAQLQGELGAREAELAQTRAELALGAETRFRYDEIAGRSEPMRAMLKLVDRVTASDVPVLLSGESGTGKELVARAIHANGPRSARPFVSENCGSVPETLLESTLFGHVRGAFTGASSTRAGLFDVADKGTLFLDEIGEMPLSMQTKLLRVLQNGEVRPVGGEKVHAVNVRIIAATHRDLEAMVAAGTFREDLFYRLDVVAVRVPPLRERREDIPLLVAHFVEKHARDRKPKVTRAAMDRLVAFPWPGNVRQLENEIRRALVLADDRIDVGELSDDIARGGPEAAREAGLGLKARVDALEAQLVKDALSRTKGNQTRAAEILGISRFGLQKMMRRLGIRAEN